MGLLICKLSLAISIKKNLDKANEYYIENKKFIKEIKMEYLVDDWFVKKRVYEL